MESVLELPPNMKLMKGLKFMPTDKILIANYLYNKLRGMVYFQDAVFDCDLYGSFEPWQIWEAFKGVDGQDLYFFTQLKRSTNKSGQLSSHVNRKVGSAGGTWSAENSLTPVFATDDNDQIIGYCRRLRYENPQMPEHHGEWIMHEYSLHESIIQQNCLCPNYVLCRIRKNERVKRKAEKEKRIMTRSNERSNKRVKNIDSFVSQPLQQCVLVAPSCEQSVVALPCEPKIMTTDHCDVPNLSVTINDFEDWDFETTIDHGTAADVFLHKMTIDEGDVPNFGELLKDFKQWYPDQGTGNDGAPKMTTDQGTSDMFYAPEMTTIQSTSCDQLPHEMATHWSTIYRHA